MPDLAELTGIFRAFGRDQEVRSPFNAHLSRQIATNPDVVGLLMAAPDEQRLPVLLLAAVHSIVLAEPDLELGRWYPTMTSDPLDSDPYPAFEQLCNDRRAQIRAIVSSRFTQTNEVGRCSTLLPALGLLDREVGDLALIDVGTSAGLNLHLDRYEYRYSPGGVVGGPSPVALECGVRGSMPVPTRIPTIAYRVGIDQHPIDLADPDEARWLMACVWPDQADRFHRIERAVEIAHRNPTEIRQADAVAGLRPAIASAAEYGHPVVMNSWVLNYLTPTHRNAYLNELDSIGADRDLSWVYAESPGQCVGLPFPDHLTDQHLTALMTVRWRDGGRVVEHLGVAHPHGYWLHWAD